MSHSQARTACARVCIGLAAADQQFYYMLTVNPVASRSTPRAQGWMQAPGSGRLMPCVTFIPREVLILVVPYSSS